jgi:hypothetical protein
LVERKQRLAKALARAGNAIQFNEHLARSFVGHSDQCRSCSKGRYAPPVHMIKLTETPYLWVHPDEER